MIDMLKIIGVLAACIGLCILLIIPASLIILALVLETITRWVGLVGRKSVDWISHCAGKLLRVFDKDSGKKSEEETA